MTTPHRFRSLASAIVAVAVLVALAWPRPVRADERSDISTARAAAEATFVEREKACHARFVVTSCVDDARRQRRATLDTLRTRQLALDEQRRQERAAERRKELADKAEDDARRDRERAAAPPRQAAAASAADMRASDMAGAVSNAAPKPRAAPKPEPRAARTPKVAEPAASRVARERANRKAFAERQADADTHREQSLDATLRRMSTKRPSASLPVPGSASAARAAAASTRTPAAASAASR